MALTGVSQITVDADEAGMRLDRWFKVHFPGVGFGQLQKLLDRVRPTERDAPAAPPGSPESEGPEAAEGPNRP